MQQGSDGRKNIFMNKAQNFKNNDSQVQIFIVF